MTAAASARQRTSLDTVDKADPNTGIQGDFWLRQMRIGFGIFLAETVVVMFYLGVSPHGPHRSLLWAIVAVWLACAVANLLLAPYVAARHWGPIVSAAWTVLSALAVGVVASLDGGIDSPLMLLLFLPVANAALAFTPLVAGLCGFTAVASASCVAAIDSEIRLSDGNALMLFAVLAGASVLSVSFSINRIERERRERQLADRIAELAATDGLTGCAVHRVFYDRFEEEIARSLRYGYPLSLMLIDVDSFKSINDTYGHLVGDHVLAGIGAMLRTHTRSFDLVGRLGGDEFAVLMSNTEPPAAAELAERIRLEASVATEVAVTLSIGVSGLDGSAPTTEHMVDDADFALYQVKGSGRDGVAVRNADISVANGRGEPQRTSAS
jgi:diguanylate cyclase (GGDEF)-like protein